MALMNERVSGHTFLSAMLSDNYFPADLVRKGQQILVGLCEKIEAEQPTHLEHLYALTHAATEEFNALAHEFEDQGSEIETVARESIGAAFDYIARAYGFEADCEELIAPRDW